MLFIPAMRTQGTGIEDGGEKIAEVYILRFPKEKSLDTGRQRITHNASCHAVFPSSATPRAVPSARLYKIPTPFAIERDLPPPWTCVARVFTGQNIPNATRNPC